MKGGEFNTWRAIRAEVLRRIEAREWEPGDVIPKEVDLAAEFNCARATVNRALQSLSEDGILQRRRKAGTRVAPVPVRRATLAIPILRLEIEALGQTYGYRLLDRRHVSAMPAQMQAIAGSHSGELLYLKALHLADDVPHALEERWIGLSAVPEAEETDFATVSANEWLVNHVPYTACDFTFSAVAADSGLAEALGADVGSPLFRIDRNTRQRGTLVTAVYQVFAPGYQLRTGLSGSTMLRPQSPA